jgi:hypothetical protein
VSLISARSDSGAQHADSITRDSLNLSAVMPFGNKSSKDQRTYGAMQSVLRCGAEINELI